MSPCYVGQNVVACGPPRGMYRRRVRLCETCERRTFGIETWDGAWYGTTYYCAVCLDVYQDGERMRRPFERDWKAKRAERIKAMWDNAKMPAEYERYARLDSHQAACIVYEGCPECDERNDIAYGTG